MARRLARWARGAERLAAALAAVLVLGLAAVASAHHGEPAPDGVGEVLTGGEEPGEALGRDSDGYPPRGSSCLQSSVGCAVHPVGATPVPKPGSEAGWEQVAGSEWREDGEITTMAGSDGKPSSTPYDLDFYGVGFLEQAMAQSAGFSAEDAKVVATTNGFAVGAQCRRDPSSAAEPVAAEAVEGCERIPVIYRYHDHPDLGVVWEESYRAPDATDPGGFAAGVTWLSPTRALAVGGTGTYPRRESQRAEGESDSDYAERDEKDGAGMARAWLYEDGTWSEIKDLPEEMRALSALHSSSRPSDCGEGATEECAIAGGMRQLWHFQDGGFTAGYGPELNESEMQGAEAFRFRIRDLRFAPPPAVPTGEAVAMALTAGCCGGEELPAELRLVDGAWRATTYTPLDPVSDAQSETAGGFADSYYALRIYRGGPGGPATAPNDATPVSGSAVRAPGGRSAHYEGVAGEGSEPRSCLTAGGFGACEQHGDVSLRLVAGDGDMTRANWGRQFGGPDHPDGRIDWAVGSLRRSGQGAAFYTAVRTEDAGMGVNTGTPSADVVPGLGLDNCRGNDALAPGAGIGPRSTGVSPGFSGPNNWITSDPGAGELCSPDGYEKGQRSRSVFKLGSYSLNAFRVTGEDLVEGDPGTGWAVGDHGAVVLRGDSGALDEEEAPRLGSRHQPAGLADPSPYEAHRKPPTDEPGLVPSLAARPTERLREPAFVSAGVVKGGGPGARDVETIAMSRDGSEGWAFGPSSLAAAPGSASTYRYERGEWRLCLPEDPEAEEACASLVPYGALTVQDVARVPLEYDEDPSNDDDFELAAITTGPGSSGGLLRYREGRWELDEDAKVPGSQNALRGHDIAFTGPDDGWVVDNSSAGNTSFPPVYWFNGERWMRCTGLGAQRDPECDAVDPDERLSVSLEQQLAGAPLLGLQGSNNRGLRLAVAGERIYAFGTRSTVAVGAVSSNAYPMIIYRDRDGVWTGGIDEADDGEYNPTDGGWDPARYAPEEGERIVEPEPTGDPRADNVLNIGATQADNRVADDPQEQGRVFTVSVAEGEKGFEGWALGTFGGLDGADAEAVMMRLEEGGWRPWSEEDAVDEYLRGLTPQVALDPRSHLTLPSTRGKHSSFIFWSRAGIRIPALAFNHELQRWEALPTPWLGGDRPGLAQAAARRVAPAVPDGQGGFWVGVRQDGSCSGDCGDQSAFFRYTDRPPKPVFSDVANPARNTEITAMAAGADGTVWLGDESGALHRYDRLTGWQRNIRVPGWDPPRSSKQTPVAALAIAPDGGGVAAGPGGRIADLAPGHVQLNAAAARLCGLGDPPAPCGTGRDLTAAAVAPDGSALVGGAGRVLLWRPAGEEFRHVETPLPRGTGIAQIELPRPDRAYLRFGRFGQASLLRGDLRGAEWTWRFELGTATSSDPIAGGLLIRSFAIDAEGRGYAVGTGGLLLRRDGDGEGPWRRIPSAYRDDLQSVALPAGGGEGALIGAHRGHILTVDGDRVALARPADPFDPVTSTWAGFGSVPQLALAPGHEAGQVEAWAVIRAGSGSSGRRPIPQALLRHVSDPGDLSLDPAGGLSPLADAPPERPGEVSFATFGKQDCQSLRRATTGIGQFGGANISCLPPNGSNVVHERIASRVTEELAERARRAGGPAFALFTGDASDEPGGGDQLVDGSGFAQARSPIEPNAKHRRWVEVVADPLTRSGLPLLGTIGGQDLALHPEAGVPIFTDRDFGGNISARQLAQAAGARGGLNLPWRNTMAQMPAPWQREDAGGGALEFERVGGRGLSRELPEAETPAASVTGNLNVLNVRLERVSTTGAPTHYATDVIRGGEAVARVVSVDTSLGSLAASNPGQHPVEVGGQERWLEDVLCIRGESTSATASCTREPGQPAIVLTNTPTYSYGPISPDETLADAAVFEEILLRHRASVVVSGRLGWNGLYWATAPGVHEPCPGQAYQTEPPQAGTRACGRGVDEAGVDAPEPEQAAGELAQELAGLGAPLPGGVEDAAGVGDGAGVLPFVVSSTAGGRFNDRAEQGGLATPEDGFWRGYSIVRVDASGDPRKTVVEQRPVLDWISVTAQTNVLRPGQRMTLRGVGREPAGIDSTLRFIPIDSAAITHRYDLVMADPGKPYIPLEDANGDYVPVPAQVASVDRTTGAIRTAKGRGESTYTIAVLSVGEHVAGMPLVFEPRRSFAAARAKVTLPALPRPARAPAPQPPVRLSDAFPPPPAAPPAAPGSPLTSQSLQLPEPPVFPSLPTVSTTAPPPPALQPPPPIAPPPPPSPAPPPPQALPQPLSFGAKSIVIAPASAVNPPAPPPINPAPPGGARKEAKQRQAATAKSEEGSSDAADKGAQADVNVGSDPSHGASRLEGEPGQHAFTRLEQRSASPLAQTALYGGGTALMALALALGWSIGRPGPRRRPPEVPAPAHVMLRGRRR